MSVEDRPLLRGSSASTVAPVFGRVHLLPRLGEFFARFPDIVVEIVVTDRTVDLVQEGVDVAIHNGPLSRLDRVARKIAATPIVTVATPEHLERYGEPRSPSDLDGRECITFVSGGAARPWRFKGKFGEIVHHPKGRLRTNDAEQIRAAVLAGLGLAHTPGWLFTREIASGDVRRILRKYERDPLSISAVHPRRPAACHEGARLRRLPGGGLRGGAEPCGPEGTKI